MAALTTLNITEKNANNSLSVTVKVNVTKEGVFLKEAYPFNEETEVFIRKRYNMSIDVNPEEN